MTGEASRFHWDLPKENFFEGLALLAEYIFKPLLSGEGIERERKIILQEYQDFWDSPYNRFWQKLDQNFWGENHPYTFLPSGTKEGILKISKEEIFKIHQKWYQPQNITLAIVGDLKEKGVKEKISHLFGGKPKTEFSPKLTLAQPAFGKKLLFSPENLKQINLSILFPTFGWQQVKRKEEIGLYMVSYLLGGSRWSKLSLKLREDEPLAYTLGTYARLYPHGGAFEINASSSLENTKRILEIIKEEIEKIKKKKINPEEFRRAKKYYLYQATMSFESVYSIASSLVGSLFREGKIILPKDEKRVIEEIRKEDLEKIAKKIFYPQKAVIGIMGEKKALEKLKGLRV